MPVIDQPMPKITADQVAAVRRLQVPPDRLAGHRAAHFLCSQKPRVVIATALPTIPYSCKRSNNEHALDRVVGGRARAAEDEPRTRHQTRGAMLPGTAGAGARRMIAGAGWWTSCEVAEASRRYVRAETGTVPATTGPLGLSAGRTTRRPAGKV